MPGRSVPLIGFMAMMGCSLALVRGPPDVVELGAPVSCTTSMLVPVVDGSIMLASAIVAAGALVGMVPGVVQGGADESRLLQIAVVSGGLALGFGISGMIGGRRVDRCQAANRAAK